jgi:hypothetical protein
LARSGPSLARSCRLRHDETDERVGPEMAHSRRDRRRPVGPLTEILRPDSAFVKSDLIGLPPRAGLSWTEPATVAPKRPGRQTRFERVLPGATDHQPPTMAWRIVSIGRPVTTPNAILRKTKYPFLRKRNQCLAEGFPSCSVGAALPGGGDVNPCVPTGRPPPHLQAGRVLQRRAKAGGPTGVRKHARATAPPQCPSAGA